MKQREKLWTQSEWMIAGENKTFVYALGQNETNIFWADVQAAGKERASKHECEAIAQLISAAPDLVESGEQLVAEFEALFNSVPALKNSQAYMEMKDAIAKAYGDSK